MSQTELIPAIAENLSAEKVKDTIAYLEKGAAVTIDLLKKIQTCETDEDRAVNEERMVKARTNRQKVEDKRKSVTATLDQIKASFMVPEKSIDVEYARARKVIEDYDNAQLTKANLAKYNAEQQKKKDQYKAELKASVERQLVDMIAGLHKTVIQTMASWEASLTLENIAEKEQQIRAQQPMLKLDKYNACFHTNFALNPILSEADTKAYIESLKEVFKYADYNERYVQYVSPIKNEYVAKLPDIRRKLEEIKALGEKKAKEAEELRKKELEKQSQQSLKEVDQQLDQQRKEVESKKDMDVLESEFREQGMTADLNVGPTKKEVKLGDNPVQQLTQVVAKCMGSEGFTLYNKKGEYIEAVQWWLTTFANKCDVKSVPGLMVEEKAKTIIKK